MQNLLKTFFLFPLLLFCGLFWTEGWANSSHESFSHPTFSCSPVPPLRFCVWIKKNRCAKKDIVHVLTWIPSPDPQVIGYKIFQGDKLIKKTRRLGVVIHHHRLKSSYLYKLVAVDSSGRESAPLVLCVVSKMSSIKCTKCPEFAVIPPFISTGQVGVFFSQNFTTGSCVNNPIFFTNSMLPAGLTLFPNGVLSGTPAQSGTFPIIVSATSAHGCTAQGPVYNLIITCDVITFTTQIVNPTCNGSLNGSLTIHATGGNSPLSYSINGGAFQASNIFNNLTAGTYTIVVKDTNGCTAQGSATLINPQTLTFATTNVNPFCDGQANGSITFHAIGGTPPYLFSIDGGSSFQSSSVFTGLSAGTYFLEVMDANLCFVSGLATLINPSPITFTTTIVNVCTSNLPHLGSITINASGGTGSFIYSNDGGTTFQSSNIFSNLSANTYFLVVQDSNGCTSSGMATVIQPPELFLDSTNNCNNGVCTITLIASGGILPYTFTIAPVGGGTPISNSTGIFSGLTCGATYTTAVVDSNGCSATAGDVTCSP